MDLKVDENKQTDIKSGELNEIVSLKENTKVSFLKTFYKDESIFGMINAILKGEKKDPADLVKRLEEARTQFKDMD